MQNKVGLRNPRIELLAIFVVAAIVFCAGLGQRDIVTSHEARVAQTARIMAESGWPWNARLVKVFGYVESDSAHVTTPKQLPDGNDRVNPWTFPVINEQIRLQKPPLAYWVTATMFRLFGVSEFSARMVPAMLGVIGALLIWDLARLILSRRAALPAALVWITTRFIVDEMRKSMADPYLAFFVLLALWAWWRCGRGRVILAWIALALGALAKGPVIFVFIIPAMILAKMFLRRRRGAPAWRGHAIGAIVFVLILVPWPAVVLHHARDAWRIWWYESGGEVSGLNIEKARPWWLYITSSFNLAMPWTPIWIAGIALTISRLRRRGIFAPRNRRRLFALSWYLAMIAFFSCLGVKKDAYLLPMMPAQVLIITDTLLMMRAALSRKINDAKQMSIVLMAMQVAIAIGFAGGIAFAMHFISDDMRVYLLCAGAIGISILAARLIARANWQRWLIAQSAAYLLLLIALLGYYNATLDNRRSPRPFAAVLFAQMQRADVSLWTKTMPEELGFYLPLKLPAGDARHVLVAVDHGRKDPPVSQKLLSELLDGATIRAWSRIILPVDDGGDRYQLFDVVVDRNRA